MNEQEFPTLRGSPFVGADIAVGRVDITRVGEGVGRVRASGVEFLVSEF